MEKVHSSEVENYILLRKWADYGIRYGDKQEIGETVVLEVEAAYPDERLQEIIKQSQQGKSDSKRKTEQSDFGRLQRGRMGKTFPIN